MKAIRVKTGKENHTTLDVGRTLRVTQLLDDNSDTLIDPEVLKKGTRINFPEGIMLKDLDGNDIDHVVVRPVSPAGRIERSGRMMFLHPITVAANQILAHLEMTEGKPVLNTMQNLVTKYYLTLVNEVAGHKGILAKSVIGTRMANSGRLVLLPQIDRSPDWVGISAAAMKKAKVKEGDLVIVFRDPVIHVGSMEVLRAYPVDRPTIELHPLLFKQFGADCDGDQMCFVKPPRKAGVKKEMEDNVLAYARKHARWPKYLCPDNLTDVPDWDHIMIDTMVRFTPTGLSYGPGDIVGWRKAPHAVKMLEKITGKEGVGERNKTYATDPQARRQAILDTNWANLYMKGYLGVVGATARRILLIMGEDPWLKGAANRCSETIQQSTLDAKHKVGSKKKSAHPIDVMEMFNRSGKWKNSSIGDCVTLLQNAEVDEEDARRIVLHFRVELPILFLVDAVIPSYTKIIREKIRSTITDPKTGNAAHVFDIVPVLRDVATYISNQIGREVTYRDVFEEIDEKYKLGIRDIVEIYYPGFSLASKGASKDIGKAVALYHQVFNNGLTDRGSVYDLILGD